MTNLDFCVVEHLGERIKDQPANLPVCVCVELRVPLFMDFAFIARYGGRETFKFAVASEDEADALLRNGHPDMNDGSPVLNHPRFSRAYVVGGTRCWGTS